MKKTYTLIILALLFLGVNSFAQSGDNCANAAPFCTGTTYNFPNNTGVASLGGGGPYGCLGSTPNPVWYFMQVATSGNLDITINQTSGGGSGIDVDFVCWGPFTSVANGCATYGAGNIIDCSYSTAATEICNIPGAVTGQFYLLLMTNFSGTSGNISFSQTGGSGSTNCAVLCNMTGLTAVPGACNPATNQFTVSGQINVTYPPTTGTLTITNSCGGSTTISPPFSSPISYSIPNITSTGGGCSVTASFSADPTCQLTTAYTSPAPCTTPSSCVTTASNTGPVCAGGTFNLATTSAGAGYSYSWSGPGGFSSSLQNPTGVTAPAAAGSYTYSVTATSGATTCTSTTIVTVNAVPAAPVAVNGNRCGNGTVNLSVTGCSGTANWYTSSSGGSPIFSGSSYTTPSLSTTTTYYVSCTVSGCASPLTPVTATINPNPTVTVNSPFICVGSSATLTAGGASSYGWSTGAITNPITVSPASTTSYTVTGTTGGCSATAVATVTVGTSMTVNAGPDDTICFGGSAQLNANPTGAGLSYAWAPAASLSNPTISNPVASPSTTTTYTLTVTDAGGCTGTDQLTILADPQITLAKTAVDVTCNGACNGQTIVIPSGGTPTYTYMWSSGCTTASCSGLCPGLYTVIITDALGCTATTDTTVSEPPAMNSSLGGTTPASCNGVCDGTATAIGGGGTGPYTYSWNSSPVQTTVSATGLCAGMYVCTITDSHSCSDTIHATVTEPTPVTNAPIAGLFVCPGGSTTLSATAGGGNGGYVYVWDAPANPGFAGTASTTVTPAANTTYTVHVTDGNGCTGPNQTVTVTVNPPLSVVASGATSICPGGSATISATASNGNGGPYTLTWTPTGTGSGSPVTVSPATTTMYYVTASDGCSPAVIDSVLITVDPLPVVTFNSNITAGCVPLCVNFNDLSTTTSGSITGWSWNFNDGTSTVQNPTHCFANPGAYSVILTTTSSAGCTSTDSISGMINVYPIPVASFSAPLSASIINPVVQFTDNSQDGSTYLWDFGDSLSTPANNTSTLQNPVHVYSEIGTYCVDLIVTSAAGCSDTTTMCVVIDPEFTFFIPNAFSPNGDGVNDEFFPKGDFIKQFEMFIYDRWGNMLFYTDDLDKHWNGTVNNGSEVCEEDVYVYVIKLKDNKDKKHKYSGIITLVK